jgi:hypothetical protein
MKLIGELFGNPLPKAERAKEQRPSHGPTQSCQSPVVSLGYRYVPQQLFGVVMILVVGWQMFMPLADWSVPLLIVYLSFWGLIALRLLTFGETQFQSNPPRIIRQWRFLGLIPVWQRDYPLKAFSGVERRHCQKEYRNRFCAWQVYLVGPSDMYLPMQLFSSLGFNYPCPKVDAYASRLAEVTGLPLLEPTRGSKR